MRSTRKRKYRKRTGGVGTPKRLRTYFGIPAPEEILRRRRSSVLPTDDNQDNNNSNPIYSSARSNPAQLYQPLTPPMSPRDYPSQFKYITNELGRVEKERDELLVKLNKFGSEITQLEKKLTSVKKKEEGEDFLIKIIAILLKLHTISIIDVSRLTDEYIHLNNLVVRAFTNELPFEPLKKIIIEINDVQKKTTLEIRVKINENMSSIKRILDKLGESSFKQIEKIFKEMNFHYEAVLTPELMRTPPPSPEGEDYRKAREKWLGKERQSDNRFNLGLPVEFNGRQYPTIKSPSGRQSPIAARPKKTGIFGKSDYEIDLAKPRRSRSKINKASGST